MRRLTFSAMLLGALLSSSAWAAQDTVTLYQVGRNGNYCLSLTTSEKGCISGTNEDGSTINVMDIIKGKNVVFRNLSDAPHDMKFSGANAEEMAPQMPNGADAVKRLGAEDMQKQKITCSFHGAQLSVGYRVPAQRAPDAPGGDGGGHKDPVSGGGGPQASGGQAPAGGPPMAGGAAGGGEPATKMKYTGLADVSGEVLKKGSAAEVASLVQARPDLLDKLKETRPLLAKEVAASLKSGLPGVKGAGVDLSNGVFNGVGSGGVRVAGMQGIAGGAGAGGATKAGYGSASGAGGSGGGGSLVDKLDALGDGSGNADGVGENGGAGGAAGDGSGQDGEDGKGGSRKGSLLANGGRMTASLDGGDDHTRMKLVMKKGKEEKAGFNLHRIIILSLLALILLIASIIRVAAKPKERQQGAR